MVVHKEKLLVSFLNIYPFFNNIIHTKVSALTLGGEPRVQRSADFVWTHWLCAKNKYLNHGMCKH